MTQGQLSSGRRMHRTLPTSVTRPNWVKSIPFFLMHLAPLGMLWFPPSALDLAVCLGLYVVRMFFITGVYHRYFSHRSYTMGRVMQFLMALGGTSCAQKGPLWWASHHRMHHKFSDGERDVHSPKDGAAWSHVGWILSSAYDETEWKWIKDFAKFPELVWLNTHFYIAPTLLGIGVYLWGGWSMLFCGFFLSTVLLYHGTFSINSLMHVLAVAVTLRQTPAGTRYCWRSLHSAKAGTTTTTTINHRPTKVFTGGKSISPTTRCACSAGSGWCLGSVPLRPTC